MGRKFLAMVVVACVGALAGADWPAFRGPKGDGTSGERGLPLKWGPEENVAWKTKLPGPGTSSPIVCKDRVFVTCYTGYGITKGGSVSDLRRHLLCLDRKTGKILWQKEVAPLLPETDFNRYINEHGYASSTPATDGERVFVFFGRTGVLAFDFDSQELWRTEVGKGLNSWGSASSPVVYRDLVLVNATIESGSLLALDRKTGKQVWRVKNLTDCWCTPLIVELPGGKAEVVLNMSGTLLGVDPEKGEQLWQCDGIGTSAATSSPVARDGVIYVMGAGGDGPVTMAVKAGGRGDVTKTHILWTQKVGTGQTSPVLHGNRLYAVSGQVWCLKTDTGEILFRERLYDARQEYVSPVAAEGRLILFTRRNGAYVLAAKDQLEQLAHNDLDDRSIFNASPAISQGQIFVRSNEYLYCLGKR
jgi:outer membrane protein assembly factor BamB